MRHTPSPEQFIRTVLFAFLATLFLGGPAYPNQGTDPNHVGGGLLHNGDLSPIDRTYSLGKSIFMGRGRKIHGLRVCLSVRNGDHDDPTAVRLSRRVLKPFKDRPIIEFTTRLVDCENPQSQVALILDRIEFRALVHFMNKRFRLRLKS